MKHLRLTLAALLLLPCMALADDLPALAAGDAAPAANPALAPSVPPVILTNVIVQVIGEERALEELPPGLLFLDADNGELMVADEDDPHGRAVCVCKDIPDYHNLTNTLRVNGHRIELNAAYSMQAEGEVLSVRAGTNAVLQILHSPQGELAPLTCTHETDRTLLLTANAPADSTLLICTNLMESPQWSTATNAVIVETTDAATTWRITLLDFPVPEFYRVRSSISLDAGIYARLPLHATQGIDIDTTNGLTMGDTTWTHLPNLDAYASTGSVAAVAADLAAHTSATNNPHNVTAAQLGSLTNETDTIALAAVGVASNRLDTLEATVGGWTPETWTFVLTNGTTVTRSVVVEVAE